MLLKAATELKKIKIANQSDRHTACLLDCLMPSDERSLTMAKAAGLTFLLFNVVSAQQVPFPCYSSWTYQGSHSSLLPMKTAMKYLGYFTLKIKRFKATIAITGGQCHFLY